MPLPSTSEFVLVPREPTPEMLVAARRFNKHPNVRKPDHWDHIYADTWRRMVCTAPAVKDQVDAVLTHAYAEGRMDEAGEHSARYLEILRHVSTTLASNLAFDADGVPETGWDAVAWFLMRDIDIALAAVPVAQLVEAGMQKSDKANLTSASGGDDLQTALPSAYINAAGISASDMPHTVVRKLDEAAIRKRPPPPALTDAQIAEMADRYGTGRAQGDNDFARAVERATLEALRVVPIAGPSSEPLLKDKKDSESMTSSPPSAPLIATGEQS